MYKYVSYIMRTLTSEAEECLPETEKLKTVIKICFFYGLCKKMKLQNTKQIRLTVYI